jgi:hypothetical protein
MPLFGTSQLPRARALNVVSIELRGIACSSGAGAQRCRSRGSPVHQFAVARIGNSIKALPLSIRFSALQQLLLLRCRKVSQAGVPGEAESTRIAEFGGTAQPARSWPRGKTVLLRQS